MGNNSTRISLYSRARIHDICGYAYQNQRTGEQLTNESLGKRLGRSARLVSDVINGRATPSREDAEAFVKECGLLS
ncbi:helix-turn-helix domain-containing protein [Brevibacillus brevis]|uniref:helix-turn-helix domain-containing protein n=1 Tax=Brevibacillus brevis TaxID=1393 RepID=UPI000E3ABE97|nr:hypothetical protein DES34_105345 [Brevibacillus brevis]VEF88673.1 Uncharacterised protein [Brevibacillus brevis]